MQGLWEPDWPPPDTRTALMGDFTLQSPFSHCSYFEHAVGEGIQCLLWCAGSLQ